ncbi:MAG: glycolate oxidase subunit GlcE [Methyloligellaceae bacterium]
MTSDHTPQTEEELADIIKEAAASGNTIRIKAGGSRQALGHHTETSRSLSTTAMSGVTHYNPGALSLVVKAGTPVSSLDQILAESGQRLAFEPMDYRAILKTESTEPTIGGVVACGISGPRRIRVGACRDALIGVRFVNGKGEIIKNGGQVMKNVTGYDLVKFMSGSFGTLGVLTELSFKTSPLPETEATFVITGMDEITANRYMSKALQKPLDITGAAHIPSEEAKTYLRLEGPADFVATRINALQNLLDAQYKTEVLYNHDNTEVWKNIRDVNLFAEEQGDIWKISVKPTDGPLYMKDLKEKISCQHYYDWAGGLIWLLTSDNTEETALPVRNTLEKFGGHATLVRASDSVRKTVPVFQPEPSVLESLSMRIKNKFDPGAILNPGILKNIQA